MSDWPWTAWLRPRQRRWRWLVAGSLVLGVAIVAWRIHRAIEEPVFYPVTITPVADALSPELEFVASRDTRIIDVAYRPDGETLYVCLQRGALNTWSALLHFWPELSLGLLGLTGLVALRRILQRQSRDAGPRCRR